MDIHISHKGDKGLWYTLYLYKPFTDLTVSFDFDFSFLTFPFLWW